MKKKSLFLLGSIVAFSALVGGTFAAWAVTDSADPFSIKISTGDIHTDEVDPLTLRWGESQVMNNVANLTKGTPQKAGVLDLRAETASQDSVDGELSYTVTGHELLQSKLLVQVFEGNITVEQAYPAQNAPTPVAFENGKANIDLDKNVANPYSVMVKLADDTTEQQIDLLVNAQVTLTFDFGPGEDVIDKKVDSKTFYATGFGELSEGQGIYAYAWKSETEKNAAWPGVKMSPVEGRNGFYSVEIKDEYTKVIFSKSNAAGTAVAAQSGDIVIATSMANKINMFTYTGVGTAKGTFGEYTAAVYKVVGNIAALGYHDDDWDVSASTAVMALKANETDIYTISGLQLTANTQLKVVETSANQWYGNESTWDNCGFTIVDGNINVTVAGTYTIELYLSPTNNNYIVLTKA